MLQTVRPIRIFATACRLFDGRVDFGLVQCAGFDAPVLEDLGVGAVVHKLLHGLLHGFGGLGIALFDGDGVRHFIEVLAELFQLTIGLGNGVADNRGIGEEDVGLAGHHSGGGVGLLPGW